MDLQDVLYIVIIFCVFWLTAFLCWFLFQIIMIVRKVNGILGDIKMQFDRIDQTMNVIKEKFHEGSGHVQSMSQDIKTYIDRAIGRK